jgi:hypothetical protein
MRREDVVLLPFVDERIDLGGDKFLQDTARFVVVGGVLHEPCLSSFRARDKHCRPFVARGGRMPKRAVANLR